MYVLKRSQGTLRIKVSCLSCSFDPSGWTVINCIWRNHYEEMNQSRYIPVPKLSAKINSSNCLLFKKAVTAVWLCTTVCHYPNQFIVSKTKDIRCTILSQDITINWLTVYMILKNRKSVLVKFPPHRWHFSYYYKHVLKWTLIWNKSRSYMSFARQFNLSVHMCAQHNLFCDCLSIFLNM